VSGWDVAMLLVVLWAGALTLCLVSYLVQITWDAIHQRAKRRRQQEP
jgi:hypothetical protein